jgi:hypothetical protein
MSFFWRTGGWNRSFLGWVGTSGREKEMGKWWVRINVVQILYTHMCKLKNDTRKGGGEVKKNNGGGKFKYDIFNIF